MLEKFDRTLLREDKTVQVEGKGQKSLKNV